MSQIQAQMLLSGSSSLQALDDYQLKLHPIAFGTEHLLSVCSTTSAGKSNVAMLAILNELRKHRDEATGIHDLDAFNIVYVAPTNSNSLG